MTAPAIPGGFLLPVRSLRRRFRECQPEEHNVSVAAPVAPENRDSASSDQEFEPRAPVRCTNLCAAAPGASLGGRGRALGDFRDPSMGRAPRLRARLGCGLPRQQVQQAQFRDYHLDAGRLLPWCGQALRGESRGGRVKAGGTSVWRTLPRGRRPAALRRFVARQHLVQDGAEGGHIGARISVAHEAVRRKQRRSSRAQHHGSRRYVAVRPAGPGQFAETSRHLRSATQG